MRRWLRKLDRGSFRSASDGPTEAEINRMPTPQLYEEMKISLPNSTRRYLIEAELRNREAWAAPAGRAVRISYWALAISVVSFVTSITLAVFG